MLQVFIEKEVQETLREMANQDLDIAKIPGKGGMVLVRVEAAKRPESVLRVAEFALRPDKYFLCHA